MWCDSSVDSTAALQTEGRAFEPGVVHYICGLLYKFAVFPRIFILQSERSGAAAQGFGEAIPKHTVAPWSAAFGGSPRRLNKPAVYDHSGRKTRHQTKPFHCRCSCVNSRSHEFQKLMIKNTIQHAGLICNRYYAKLRCHPSKLEELHSNKQFA